MYSKLILLILLTLHLACQSRPVTDDALKPKKVYRIVYEIKSNEWYKKQALLWKNEINKNPDNPEAWYNYYNANRYAHFEEIESQEKQNKLEQIIEDMGKAVPNSYEFALLKNKTQSDIHDLTYIKEAYGIDPQRPETYYDFIAHYVTYGEKQKFKQFCEKLYNSGDIEPWLLNYNYNVLMSLEPNAVLITNGDNDTYPVWLLQQVKAIHPDITVLNISLLTVEKYFENQLTKIAPGIKYSDIAAKAINPDAPRHEKMNYSTFIQETVRQLTKEKPQLSVYFALTVYNQHLKPFKDDLYITGLAYRYSKARIDNIAMIKNNLENKFRIDYLEHNWYKEQMIGKNLSRRMNLNYVVPMMMLAEHYETAGENSRAIYWKDLALHLAEEAGNENMIKKIAEKGIGAK